VLRQKLVSDVMMNYSLIPGTSFLSVEEIKIILSSIFLDPSLCDHTLSYQQPVQCMVGEMNVRDLCALSHAYKI
jgi:hypothetical protein